ncbi:M28 family peptidase [Paraurantiacibacter namhicola]|uniref:Aminopeptidase YwaD n=1 Tax=Paraurantiacibacter namhicola TaxID=645517 RepID=A0A1C7D929_9SPHN|nr:M28 family peptidase [Paraurantiacibacter namhicola]ANU07821.1 Aminopeptidase YwaD precursor [Paraurantiacibacter namhicola]
MTYAKHFRLAGAAALAIALCTAPSITIAHEPDAAATAEPLGHGGPPSEAEFQMAQAALAAHMRILSSDEFAGRLPGTEGGRLTQSYIIANLQSYGFVPGASDTSWRQPLSLERFVAGAAELTAKSGGASRVLDNDMMVVSGPPQSLADLPVVFADAETEVEPGSMQGKAVLISGKDIRGMFGTLMAAQPSALLIQTGTPEEYGMFSGFIGTSRWQVAGEDSAQPPVVLLPPEAGFIAEGAAAIDSVSLENASTVETAETANVIGKLPGKVPGSGAILVLSHWDHLGDECGPITAEDRICNGAVDNASGTGVMLEVARMVAMSGGLDRDLYIMGTTAEEMGLLGARHFAANPPFPLDSIVAAFNIDSVAIAPRGSTTTVVGSGRTPLDEGIEMVVESVGGTYKVDPYTEQFVRRQDGFALLASGVPTVLVSSSFGDEAAFSGFLEGPYHGADDDWREDIELGGATDDIFTHVALLKHFGSVDMYTPPVKDEAGGAEDAAAE